MITKQLEIRDRGTMIPALAIQVSGADGYLMRRAGYGEQPLVILIHLEGMHCAYDPYGWHSGARTMKQAHLHITEHFDDLADGDVIDVEFILGERPTKKASEAVTHGE